MSSRDRLMPWSWSWVTGRLNHGSKMWLIVSSDLKHVNWSWDSCSSLETV